MLLDLPIPKEFVSETGFYDYKYPITGLIAQAKELGAVIITKDDEYYGIIDSRSASREGSLKFNKGFPAGKVAMRLPMINAKTDIMIAVGYFYESRARALAYEENGKVKGIVKREKILSAILSRHSLSKVKVSDAMTTPIITIDANGSVAQAQTAMRQNGINRIVIISRNKPTGIVTHGDIASAFSKPEERRPEMKVTASSFGSIQIGSISTTNLHEIDYDENIDTAIRRIVQDKAASLVVTRGGRAVGMLTARDILRATLETEVQAEKRVIIAGLDDYTKDSEEEIRSGMEDVVEKVSKFTGLEVSSATVMVKRSKARNYELNASLFFERRGSIRSSVTGYSLDAALKSLEQRMYKLAAEKKDEAVTEKRKRVKRSYDE